MAAVKETTVPPSAQQHRRSPGAITHERPSLVE